MSIYAGFSKLIEVLNANKPPCADDITWPDVTETVWPEAYNGPHPAWYMEHPTEQYESAGLQPAYITGSRANLSLYVLVGVKDLPDTVTNMSEYLMDVLGPTIREAVLAAVRARTFDSDGSRGSAPRILGATSDWNQKKALGYYRIDFEISEYL